MAQSWKTIKSGVWLLPLLGALQLLPCLAFAQEARTLETIATSVAAELAQRFPAVTGEVVKVEGEHVYLSLGAQDNLREGVQLTLFREGEVLKQPTTGAVLGRLEEELGVASVVQVFERYALATVAQPAGKDAVRSGDKVRITAGRIALGLLPFVLQTRQPVPLEELSDALQRALDATGRFRVTSRDQVAVWLLRRGVPPEGVVAPDLLPELAKALQLSYVLMPLVKDLRGTAVLDLLLLLPNQPQTPVATASALLPAAALARRPPEPPPAPPPPAIAQPPQPPVPEAAQKPSPPISERPLKSEQPEQRSEGVFKTPPQPPPGMVQWNLADSLTELHKLPGIIVGIDGSDVDADGKAEIVTIVGSEVALYRLDGERLERLGTFTSRRQGRLLSVQLLRLAAPHTVGIVVNRQVADGTVDSFILTLQGQRLVLLQEHVYDILLAVDTDGDGIKESLWGQLFDQEQFFRRERVRRYALANGTLEPQESVPMPATFRATGATLAKFSAEGPRHLVFVDVWRHLRVYRGEEDLWRSRNEVGGGYTSAEIERTISRDVVKKSFYFEPIPAVVDVDGDGVEEVLVARNAAILGFIPNLNQYSGGDVVLLRKEKYGFNLLPIGPEFNGVVSGVVALPGSPRTILIAVSKQKGFLQRGGETTLFLSRLPGSG